MESSRGVSSATSQHQQEEPLDLSTGNGNGELTDDHVQIVQLIEACSHIFQQNLYAMFLQSMLDQAVSVQAPPVSNTSPLLEESSSPEKENIVFVRSKSNLILSPRKESDKEHSYEHQEHDCTPSPVEIRRRTSSGKIDRRMVGKNCSRRTEANARERNRVQQLSKKFDQLKECLPVEDDSKISKLATLKVACAYIAFLGSLLKDDNFAEEDDLRRNLHIELESAKTLRK
uniref:BHLH domain-containing protein n=1 Tax=Caenorhabditis japonica TaxID=281687 RepID=A0A8R1DYB8_CAEJA